MQRYETETYGEHVADVYDDWYPTLDPNPEAEVALLAELTGGGRALELGIGTGRVAVPLAARGVEVHGIDASPAMVARLREKPGGDAIPVTIGDMAEVAVEGTFSLVFVVFNTFFMLTTQAEQLRCMRNVAARLAPGGAFLIRAFVPDPSRFVNDGNLSIREVGVDSVRLDVSRYDAAEQRVDTTHVHITEQGIRLVHLELRFASPPELDVMAELAGLRLESRWESFDKAPFTPDSPAHVSVYRAPSA